MIVLNGLKDSEFVEEKHRKLRMNALIVGGNFGGLEGHSGIVFKLSDCLAHYAETSHTINGGLISDLPSRIDEDLAIWMPNIENEEPKHYPLKRNGTVLICSKVMREGTTHMDAISRIFKMHGNAVIEIELAKKCVFTLIDALGNIWYKGDDVSKLGESINDFYHFTKAAVRIPTVKADNWKENLQELSPFWKNELEEFLNINRGLQEKVMSQCGNRFFGNLSTRCQKLFPSMSNGETFLVSPRNSDKASLEVEDLVCCALERDHGQLPLPKGRGL